MSKIHSTERLNSCLIVCLIVLTSHVCGAENKPLETITVTATRLPRNIEDIAGTVTLITDAEIEQQLSVDIDDLIRYQPGITMDTAGRGGNQGFIIRGIGGNRVLTLIDGVRGNDIYDAVVSGYGRDVYEIDDLKAVEIIRGPASVLYGADAMGGAVILRTRDPVDYLDEGKDVYIGIRGSAASAGEQYKAGFTAAAQHNDLGGMLQYNRREFHEKDIQGEGELNPLDGRSNNLFAKVVWNPHEDHRLTLAFDSVMEEIDSILNTDLSASVFRSTGADETERYRISLNHLWQLDLLIADQLDTQFYWQQTDALQYTEQQRRSYSFINPIDFTTFGGTLADRTSDFAFNQGIKGGGMMLTKGFTTGDVEHTMVYGFNIDQTATERPRNRCDTAVASGARTCAIAAYPFAPPEVFPNKTFPDTETTRAGVYWQDEIVLGNSGFTFIPGLRYDRYEMDPSIDGLLDVSAFGFDVVPVEEDELSLNLGLIYDLNDNIALFAQYAEGFRPPNYEEANQAFVNRSFSYATVPNPDLQPETSQGLELGVKANFDRAYLSMAFYDNRYKDFIDSQFIGLDSGISLFQNRNIGEARVYGAEASAIWRILDQWQLRAAIAYAHGDDKEAGVPLDTIDPLTGVLGLRYEATDNRWGVETILTLVDEKGRVSSDDKVTANGYGLVDLFGHYNVTNNATLRAGVFNLLDKQYARWANIQGFNATDTNAIARAQETGINFRLGMKVQF